MEENEMKIIDQRDKPLEAQIADFLISKGIHDLEQVKELLEPSFYAVIPISILEKKTISANAKLLYAEIMALSKKSGKCFATNEYLADRLGLAKRTIPSLLKELRDDFLIQVSIKRNQDGTYRDITLSLIGDGGCRQKAMGGIAKERCQKRIRQIELDNKNMSDKPTFSLKDEIQKLLTDKKRHIQIIGLWIQEMGLRPENQEQVQSIIHRNVRPAKLLIGYKDEDIIETIKTLKKTDYLQNHFTLETIAKFIDDIVANRKKRGPKIIRWEEVPKPDGTIAMRPIYEKQTI